MFSFITKSFRRRRLEKEGLATPKKRLKEEESLWHILDQSPGITLFIFLVLWILCSLFLLIHSFNTKEPDLYLIENQLAPKTVYADFTYTYLDRTATSAKKEMAEKSVPLMYIIRDSACEDSINDMKKIVQNVESALNLDDPETADIPDIKGNILPPMITLVKDKQQLGLFNNKFNYILYSGIISDDEANAGRDKQTEICVIDKFNHVRPAQMLSEIPTPSMAAKIFADSVASDYSPQARKLLHRAVYVTAKKVFKPNLFFDSNLTQIEREIVSSSPHNEVHKQVVKGDIVFKKGEKVTYELLDKYKAYEDEKNKRIV